MMELQQDRKELHFYLLLVFSFGFEVSLFILLRNLLFYNFGNHHFHFCRIALNLHKHFKFLSSSLALKVVVDIIYFYQLKDRLL
jgi:hypothetical protein